MGPPAIPERFKAQVARAPEATAVVCEDQSLSYAELKARANRLAHYLRERGAGPDVLVGLSVERSLEMIVGVLGILKAGAAYVPLDPTYPAERLAYMAGDAALSLLVTQSQLVERLSWYTGAVVSLDREEAAIARMPAAAVGGGASRDNLAYVTYTSGSTGRPKGVMTRHGGAVNYLRFIVAEYGVTANAQILQVPTLSFDASVRDIFGCLIVGGRLRVMREAEAKQAEAVVAHIRRDGITAILSIAEHEGPPLARSALSTAS